MDHQGPMYRCCWAYLHFHYLVDACCENPVCRCLVPVCCDEFDPDLNRPLEHKVAFGVVRTILNFLGSLLSVFLLWLIFFRPYKVRPYVDAAELSAFTSTFSSTSGDAALQYDLAANVSFFNDHHVYGVRFDHLTAWLYYNGTKLGTTDDTLPSFRLGPRRHRMVHPTMRGRVAGDVGAAAAAELSRQQVQGRPISLDVRVKTTLTYMFWPVRATYYYEYGCWLQFPTPGNSGWPAVTNSIKCLHVAN